MSYFYATAFAQVGKTLTAQQKGTLNRHAPFAHGAQGPFLVFHANPIAEHPQHGFSIPNTKN